MPAGHSEGFGETFRELPSSLHARRRRRAARRAGLPDLRGRPRAGADRRRDRPLARGGPLGRGASRASSSTATARWSIPSRCSGRRGGGSGGPTATRSPATTSRPASAAVRPHPRLLRRARRAARRRTRSGRSSSGELFALIDAPLEPFADAVAAVAGCGRAACGRRGLVFGARAAGPHARPCRASLRGHDRRRRGRARQARAGHVPARGCAARGGAGALCRGRGLAARRRSRARGGDADARRLPRRGQRGCAAADLRRPTA